MLVIQPKEEEEKDEVEVENIDVSTLVINKD